MGTIFQFCIDFSCLLIWDDLFRDRGCSVIWALLTRRALRSHLGGGVTYLQICKEVKKRASWRSRRGGGLETPPILGLRSRKDLPNFETLGTFRQGRNPGGSNFAKPDGAQQGPPCHMHQPYGHRWEAPHGIGHHFSAPQSNGVSSP